MKALVDPVLIILVLTNLALLGRSRLIRMVAFQGAVLGLLPILSAAGHVDLRACLLTLGSVTLKGFVFPILLFRAVKQASVRREQAPYIGHTLSVIAGLIFFGASLWMGSRIEWGAAAPSPLIFPAALSTILSGLFLIVARRKALTQVVGFLVMENGIYTFGVALVGEVPMLVELGVLLDVFVAVFVMGIALQQISRAFDHIDADQMNSLKG